MPNALDLNLLPLARSAGQDQSDLPGLFTAEPPRRAARGRGTDSLLLYLNLEGNLPLSPGKLEQLLDQVSKRYYETPGSVSSAMRSAVDSLNSFLLERNLRSASTGRQSLGWLCMLALREEQIFVTLSGPVHMFGITAAGNLEWYDPDMEGLGLGQGRVAPLRFYQANLRPNETWIATVNPPATWEVPALQGLFGQGPESLRRRLMSRAGIDLSAVLLQVRPGTGKIISLRPRSAPAVQHGADLSESEPGFELPGMQGQEHQKTHTASPAAAAPRPAASAGRAPDQAPPLLPRPGIPSDTATPPPAVQQTPVASQPSPEVKPAAMSPDTPGAIAGSPEASIALAPAAPVAPGGRASAQRSPRRKLDATPLLKGIAGLMRPFAALAAGLGRAGQWLGERLLPEDALSAIPSSTMAFIAIAVPVVVVAVATLVYRQQGLNVQAKDLLTRAQASADLAESLIDPTARRSELQNSLKLIGQVEILSGDSSTTDLRQRVEKDLDALELIKRTLYSPAIIGGLPDNVEITRIVISENDLYLLDGKSGSVLHALVTAHGYEVDRAFICGPGAFSGVVMGAVVDIASLPGENAQGAAVQAIDAAGNMLYCNPNKAPKAASLTPPPMGTLNNLVSFTLDQGDLYALDPPGKAVWIYWRSDPVKQPQFFFNAEVPPLKDTISLAVNSDELYLLHKDGHLSICYYSSLKGAPGHCTEPAAYIDLRPGKEGQPMTPIPGFTQVLYAPPPDPSLYLLEPVKRAIYRFTLRNLAFQGQVYGTTASVPQGPATAFAVNQVDRTLFLAIGNEVFYGTMP